MAKYPSFAFGGVAADLHKFESQPLRAKFLARGISALAKIAERLDSQELGAAIASPSNAGALLTALTQPGAIGTFGEGPLTAARLRGIRARDALLAAEGGTMTAEQVGALLHITRQAIDKRRAAGKLIAVEFGRRGYRYPAWQFSEEGVLAGLQETLELLKEHPPIAQMRFFLSGSHVLGGKRPLDLLRRDEAPRVIKAARLFGEQGAA